MNTPTDRNLPLTSAFVLAIKGQKYKTYAEEVKMESSRLHIKENWTYREINARLGIRDKIRMKR